MGESVGISLKESGRGGPSVCNKTPNKQPNCLNITAHEDNAYEYVITPWQLIVLLCCFCVTATLPLSNVNRKKIRGIGKMASTESKTKAMSAFVPCLRLQR